MDPTNPAKREAKDFSTKVKFLLCFFLISSEIFWNNPNLMVPYITCLNKAASKPLYNPATPDLALISLNTSKGFTDYLTSDMELVSLMA